MCLRFMYGAWLRVCSWVALEQFHSLLTESLRSITSTMQGQMENDINKSKLGVCGAFLESSKRIFHGEPPF